MGDQQQGGAVSRRAGRTAGPSPPGRRPGPDCRSARRPAAAAAGAPKARASADPLLLAAGELAGQVRQPLAQADQAAGGPRPSASVGRPFHRNCHIFQRGHGRDQVEGLEDHADILAAERRQAVLVQSRRRSVAGHTAAPLVARSSPAITINRVDLPEPEGPTRLTASPAAISRSMPRRILTRPAVARTVKMEVSDLHERRGADFFGGNRGRRDGIHGGDTPGCLCAGRTEGVLVPGRCRAWRRGGRYGTGRDRALLAMTGDCLAWLFGCSCSVAEC